MANFESYRTAKGVTRHLAVIRIKGFKRTSKSFALLKDAKEWAEQIEKDLRAQRERGGTSAEVSTINVRTLIERFLQDPKTRENSAAYLLDLEQMLAVWAGEYGATRAREFNRGHVTTFRNKLLGQGKSTARTNRYLSGMRRAWNWAIEEGYVLQSAPWPTGVMLKEPDEKEVIATPEEIAQMFAACDATDEPLGSLARFLVGTGARLSDALAVTDKDVNLAHGDAAIRGQKTGTPLRVAMLAPAVEAVKRAMKMRHVSRRLFWQFEDRLDAYSVWRRARKAFPPTLADMRMHDCRHLCASLLAANGATAVELAAQLGHSTLQMVKRYSHLRGGHRGAAHEKLDKAFGNQ